MTERAEKNDITVADVAAPGIGQQIGKQPVTIHGPERCAGRPCPFHNPSDHPLKDAPMNIRFDKACLVERFCAHGVGHDDPDSVAWLHSIGETWAGTHGCDGCCVRRNESSPTPMTHTQTGE